MGHVARVLGPSRTSCVRAALESPASPYGALPGCWQGWIAEIPGVNCQERTREALLETLRVTLAEAIEVNRQEARQAAGEGYEEVRITV